MRTVVAIVLATLLLVPGLQAWGPRGHYTANRAAVRAIPDDGPTFLRAHEDWIVHLATVPDSWRVASEPFQKIIEDPNHGWFREQFAFLKNVDLPRSRYEFVLALDKEHRRLVAAGDTSAAALTNVRWTGTMAYAAVETYEQMVAGMRRYRAEKAQGADTRLVEMEIASYMGRLGHYTADGAQPLHDTIHHDGWQGPNPKGYATDPRVHGRFETQFVDRMKVAAEDIQNDVPPATAIPDVFDAVLAHLDDAAMHVEQVYQLDKAGVLRGPDGVQALAEAVGAEKEAEALVRRQLTRAAALLRDLACTAWIRSAEPMSFTRSDDPISRTHPHYNPATGSAPAPRRPLQRQ